MAAAAAQMPAQVATRDNDAPENVLPAADGSAKATAPVKRTVEAIGVPQKLVEDFSKQYQLLVFEAASVEQSAKDIRRIVDANFAVYKLLSSFLETLRSYAASNRDRGAGGSVVISVHDLDALESERELRLLRAIVSSNAETVGLGNSFLASIDPANLKRSITDALNNLANKGSGEGSSGGEEDETAEERRPENVNLDDNGGLYAIRPTDEALSIDRLVGYQNEAREIVSFCQRVNFVTGSETEKDLELVPRNPVVVILYGPPGSGKTTVAQSVAKYLDCVYMYVNAENVTSQWAGGTEKNIAKLFRRARIASVKFSPDPKNARRTVLLLIDEIDGLVKNRATSLNLTGEEYNRITTFLQMLTPPIGVNNSNLICIFTTNRLDNIDAAIVNRARGKIFMGYVVSPLDRVRLVDQIFRDYVNGAVESDRAVQNAAIQNDELVPRDLQNLLALVKNRILARFGERNPGAVQTARDVVINLSDSKNKISTAELAVLLAEASPGTDAATLFRDYSPPLAHVCRWLAENRQYLSICRSAAEYRNHGRDCK